MESFDLVIRGGQLITGEGIVSLDLGIQNGKIKARGENLVGRNTIDASDFYVLPGGIDPHVHFQMPTATTMTSDDWSSGTLAAACGGTTTVIDFVEPEVGQSLSDALNHRKAEAEGNVWVDYALHMTITNCDSETLTSIEDMMKAGVSSFKVYTTYDGMKLDHDCLMVVFEKVTAAGGLCLVHAEQDELIQKAITNLVESQKLSPRWFPSSRPAQAEFEAVERCIHLASAMNTILYIVHLSTSAAIALVDQARKNGKTIIAETCPQYLVLNNSLFTETDEITAASLICSPPLRDSSENQAIWTLMQQGKIQSIGSDHCSFRIDPQKIAGLTDFRKVPGGLPGVELRLPLLYTFGVQAGYISLQDWIQLCSTQPAKIFGLYPQKGSLDVGADADIVLFDPNKEVIIQKKNLHEQVDYSPYEKLTLTGFPVMTISKGTIVMENGKWVSDKKSGTFLNCGSPSFI